MRPRRTDENQARIMRALGQIPGLSVFDSHAFGRGFPDLIIGFRGRNYFFELKNPIQPRSGQRLTEVEKRFHSTWRGRLIIVTTLEEILEAMDIKTERDESNECRIKNRSTQGKIVAKRSACANQ